MMIPGCNLFSDRVFFYLLGSLSGIVAGIYLSWIHDEKILEVVYLKKPRGNPPKR